MAGQMQASCASGFQIITSAVVVSQGMYSAGSERLLTQARDVLINSGIIPVNEFAGVAIRWAKLSATGMTPDRDLVLLSEAYLHSNDLAGTAATLAHEMTHVRQYRRMGTDAFKCEYSKLWVRCGGCQDEHHTLEAEAYQFQRQAEPRIASFIQQGDGSVIPWTGSPNVPVLTTVCSTPAGMCSYTNPMPFGLKCSCTTQWGVVIWGRSGR